MPARTRQTCPVCQIGRMQRRKMTYNKVFNGTLVSVPNTDATLCDFCGSIGYDSDTLQRVNMLMQQAGPAHREAGRRSKPVTKSGHSNYSTKGKP